MKKIKKIKIKVNGELKVIKEGYNLLNLINNLKIPIKKVAIELNKEIVVKKKLNIIKLKNNDKIEIVHFIGGG
jgi:sulfur carrier protein